MKWQTLIVEDEPKAQTLLVNLVKLYCPQIQVCGLASTISDALSQIREYKPNLVFLDVHLHGENGLKLIEFTQNVPFEITFIITTANQEFKNFCAENPNSHLLLKPLQINELQKLMAQLDSTKPNI